MKRHPMIIFVLYVLVLCPGDAWIALGVQYSARRVVAPPTIVFLSTEFHDGTDTHLSNLPLDTQILWCTLATAERLVASAEPPAQIHLKRYGLHPDQPVQADTRTPRPTHLNPIVPYPNHLAVTHLPDLKRLIPMMTTLLSRLVECCTTPNVSQRAPIIADFPGSPLLTSPVYTNSQYRFALVSHLLHIMFSCCGWDCTQ